MMENKELKYLTGLNRVKNRYESGYFFVEGKRLVESAISYNADIKNIYATESFLEENNSLKDLIEKLFISYRETFSDPAMIELLSSINAIKADVSKNTEDDIELMKKLSVFGPPTLIVYDQNGIERENIRKIGVVNAKELIRDIKNIQQ